MKTNLKNLLQNDPSPGSQCLRASLLGLQTQVQEWIRLHPSDPQIVLLKCFLSDLEDVLAPSHSPSPNPPPSALDLPPNSLSSPTPPSALPIQPAPISLKSPSDTTALAADLLASLASVSLPIPRSALQIASAREIWTTLHLHLLGYSAAERDSYQKTLHQHLLKNFGGALNPAHLQSIAFPVHHFLFPGIEGPLNIPGLQLDPGGTWHPKLAACLESESLENLPATYLALAQWISTWLYFSELDLTLHHALLNLHPHGFLPLNKPDDRQAYQNELLHRFGRFLKSQNDPLRHFLHHIALDEALQSLIHLRPPDRNSYLGHLRDEMRASLQTTAQAAQSAGVAVEWKPLWGKTDVARRLTRRQNDLSVDQGGVRGEIAACLRVYAKIQDEDHLGRVVFRDLRDSP